MLFCIERPYAECLHNCLSEEGKDLNPIGQLLLGDAFATVIQFIIFKLVSTKNMKRKRGAGRRKPILAAVEGAKETVPNIIGRNTQDELGLDDIDNAEFETRMEIDTPQNGSNRRRQQAGLQAQKVVDVTMEDSTSSFHETEAAVSAILSKITRSIRTRSAKGLTSSSIEPGGNPDQLQDRRAQQKEPNMPRQDPQHIEHKEQELKAALAVCCPYILLYMSSRFVDNF